MKDKFLILDAKLKDAQAYLRDAEAALEGLSDEHHTMVYEIRRLRMRQVRASEDMALAQDMHGLISTEVRYYKAQFRTR